MNEPSGILFYGDAHGCWQPLLDEHARQPARAVVVLGDCELDRPLDEVLAPVLAAGTPVHWIHGNHDGGSEAQWACLAGSEGGLHGRVANLGGVHVAGLGGTYAGRAWYPKAGGEDARYRTRRDWLKATPRNERCGSLLPLRNRHVILPEDHAALAGQQADVLVCHEAPTSHEHGFGALDDLALELGARLVVHGHHHQPYTGASRDGLQVRGLGIAECWRLED